MIYDSHYTLHTVHMDVCLQTQYSTQGQGQGQGQGHDPFIGRLLLEVVQDATKRLLLPQCIRGAWRHAVTRAESAAVQVFCDNTRAMLLTPPLRCYLPAARVVCGVDPGFKHVCGRGWAGVMVMCCVCHVMSCHVITSLEKHVMCDCIRQS